MAIILSLAFLNTNAECKEVIRPLRAWSASVDEWIRKTSDICHCLPHMTLTGDAFTKNLVMTQDFKYVNCSKQGHFRINCKKNQINPKSGPYLWNVKVSIWLVNVE